MIAGSMRIIQERRKIKSTALMQTSFILMDRLMPILKAKLRHAIPAAVVMTDSIYALSSKGLTALLLRGEFCAQRIDVDKTP